MTTFSQVTIFPHFTANIAALITSFIFFGQFLVRRRKNSLFLAAIFSNLCLMIHPYQMVVIFSLPLIVLATLFLEKNLCFPHLLDFWVFFG